MTVSGAAVAIIPARYASTRFPGKLLAEATGKPLIVHVIEAASRANCIGRVVVATDDSRIAGAVHLHGPEDAEVVMTSAEHPNGTSRLAEAARTLGLGDDEIVVNVQGDEPEIEPEAIDIAVDALVEGGTPMATLASAFADGEDPANPNVVKVVLRTDRTAMYFSRALVPYRREAREETPVLRHVGLYVYRASFLARYATMEATPLERAEALEQLRVLEHGEGIAVGIVPASHEGIDTPEQYEAFVRRWRARGG